MMKMSKQMRKIMKNKADFFSDEGARRRGSSFRLVRFPVLKIKKAVDKQISLI